jgi:hypothetical protein
MTSRPLHRQSARSSGPRTGSRTAIKLFIVLLPAFLLLAHIVLFYNLGGLLLQF